MKKLKNIDNLFFYEKVKKKDLKEDKVKRFQVSKK